MEEKKVCTECENKEPKLEKLTNEEAAQVAGGHRHFDDDSWYCKNCGVLIYDDICPYCKKDQWGKQH